MIPGRGIWDDDQAQSGTTLSSEDTSHTNGADEWTLSQRIKRGLSRRFPRLRIAFDITRGYIGWGRDLLLAFLSLPRWSRTVGWLRRELASLSARRSEERLTVGIEIASFWEPLTGIGWYLYRLLEHLADRDDLRIRLYGPSTVRSSDSEDPVVVLPAGPAIELVQREVPDGLALPAGRLIGWLRRLEPLLIAADGNDVLFAPNYFLPRRFDLARGARVATVHDLGLKHFAWTLRRETLLELNEKFEHAVFEAARLITVSGAIKEELVAEGLADPERVTVVHHGPGQLATVEPGELPAGTPGEFALHVGTIEPRKNVAGLLDTWRHVRERLENAPTLVLCGKFGWKTEAVRAKVDEAERQGWLLHLGYVEDAELAALYRDARVVVFPTLYEGFGLPAVEALWAETPLVCSDLPVLREVTGGAALFAPPDRPDLFAERVIEALESHQVRSDLISAGTARVRELSWTTASELTASVWAQAAGSSGNGVD
ncbi:MAG: glycosyltransferase family 4 protein [bacterium]|nr:glycosyltransferase family 4 protein [bacterium]